MTTNMKRWNSLKKTLFDIEMMKADVMVGVERTAYWTGYINGLKRRFHGETHGTQEEHAKWMAAAADGDEVQKEQSLGYRDGYLGAVDLQDPANGIAILRKWRGWSIEELAAKAGVSPERVRLWEVGQIPDEDELRILEKLRSE
jgi:DNA-binding transcriptional regulator YiaG